MNWISNFWGHLKTINHHKYLVMRYCMRVGLYRQGLMHDLSKYAPAEFWVGVKYFQGNRSPNDAQRHQLGYSSAWLRHKGRTKHHLEYWIDYSPVGDHSMTGMKMPVQYVVEMFCDRVAASRNYRKDAYTDRDPYDYYDRARNHYILHPDTRALLEMLLEMLRDQGEDATFSFIQDQVLTGKLPY